MERKNILIGQRQRVRKQNSEELVRWQFECHLIEHLRVKGKSGNVFKWHHFTGKRTCGAYFIHINI